MGRNEKQDFYRATARYHEASCRLYNVDAVVHLENDNDRWFWQQALSAVHPERRYRFIGSSMSPQGNMTSGCGICLKYRRYLSRRFFVCIDSDLRYLLGRDDIQASRGILQTYTYSWENHVLHAYHLQAEYDRLHGAPRFDFVKFMRRYSQIVYEPLLLMLWCEKNHRQVYKAREFNHAITMTEERDDERMDGRLFLERLERRLAPARELIAGMRGLDIEAERRRYAAKGLTRDNAYLYVRGHCIYNALRYIGRRLIGERIDKLLRRPLTLHGATGRYGRVRKGSVVPRYAEATRLLSDVRLIDHMRR